MLHLTTPPLREDRQQALRECLSTKGAHELVAYLRVLAAVKAAEAANKLVASRAEPSELGEAQALADDAIMMAKMADLLAEMMAQDYKFSGCTIEPTPPYIEKISEQS